MPDEQPVVLTVTFDAIARDASWLLVRPTEEVELADFDDVFVFGAVAWSEWDVRAARALDAYVRRSSGVAVVVFNVDDEPHPAHLHERRFPGLANLPVAVPVIARYRAARLERFEEGMPAVEWVEGLARELA